MLTLNINNIGITLASASNAIFFNRVPCLPIVILFFPLLFVKGSRLEKWRPIKLAVPWRIRRTVLYCCVSISDITKVVDVSRSQEGPGSKRMNRCISPLFRKSEQVLQTNGRRCLLFPSRSLRFYPSCQRSHCKLYF